MPPSSAVEVGPLELSKWSMFEKPETGSESKKSDCHHRDKKGRTHNDHKKTGRRVTVSSHPSSTWSVTASSSAKGAAKEHGKPKGSGKKRDS